MEKNASQASCGFDCSTSSGHWDRIAALPYCEYQYPVLNNAFIISAPLLSSDCSLHGLTSKVGAVAQLGLPVPSGQHADSSMLDEVHLASHCAFADDEIGGLEDLEAELGQHGGHKVGVGVGEEGHVGHQAAAVEADDLLEGWMEGKTRRH